MALYLFNNVPTAGNDIIRGKDDDETLIGFNGDDSIYGGGGADIFWQGWHEWFHGDYWDSFVGPFEPYLDYDFSRGNDVLVGGDGFDWIVYAERSWGGNPNLLDLTAGTITKGHWTDRFSEIEAFALGYRDDVVVGRQAGVVLRLGGGNDTLSGLSGFAWADGGGQADDTVDYRLWQGALHVDLGQNLGGGGSQLLDFDVVIGSETHANTLIGDEDRNRLTGGALSDDLRGAAGNDVLTGGMGADSLFGDLGDDLVRTGGASSQLMGGGGNDTLKADGGGDTLLGEAGDDRLQAALGNNSLNGGAGNDRLVSGRGDDLLLGEADADTLQSGAGADQLFGNDADDVLRAGDGNDTLYGGAGADSLFAGAADDVAYVRVDHLIEMGAGADHVLEDPDDGESAMPSHVRQLSLGDGNDTVTMSGTVHRLEAGRGDDSVTLWGALDMRLPSENLSGTVAMGDGQDTVTCHFGTVLGGAGDDTILVTTPEAWVYGVADGNTGIFLSGGSGSDSVTIGDRVSYDDRTVVSAYGGTGKDTLTLGSGRYIDLGGLTEAEVARMDQVLPSMGLNRFAGFEQVTIAGAEVQIFKARTDAQTSFGSDADWLVIDTGDQGYDMGGGDDVVHVAAGQVTLQGGDGADRIDIRKGFNTVYGGSGNDQITAGARGTWIYGGDGDDRVSAYGAGPARVFTGLGNDSVSAEDDGLFVTGAGDDVLELGPQYFVPFGDVPGWDIADFTGTGAMAMTGDGNDTAIVFSHAPDSVDLGAGDDQIIINTRANQPWDLTTGDGADRLYFVTSYHGVSQVRVADFDPDHDLLCLVAPGTFRPLTTLDEIDAITATDGGTRLIEGGITIDLMGVQISDLSDAILTATLPTPW